MKKLTDYLYKIVEVEMDDGELIKGEVINVTFPDESDEREYELDIISSDGLGYACPESMIKSVKVVASVFPGE